MENVKNNIFVIDDGTREITLENPFHEVIATLRIRVSDIGIVDRYKEMVKELEKAIIPLKDISTNADGTAEFQKDWDLLKQVEADVIDRINDLFDITNAGDIFKTRNAFSAVNGVFFVEIVLSGLGKVIQQNVAEEAVKAQERTKKYTEDIEKAEKADKKRG